MAIINRQIAHQINSKFDRACNADIIDIIITGDFNCNMTQRERVNVGVQPLPVNI